MTTAARPTWTAALGGRSIKDTTTHKIVQVQVRDLPQYTQLKLRQPGQNTADELQRRDLKRELEQAELEYRRSRSKYSIGSLESQRSYNDGEDSEKLIAAAPVVPELEHGDGEDENVKQRRLAIEAAERQLAEDQDSSDDDDSRDGSADSDKNGDESEDDDDDDDDEEEEEDDTAELMRELEKIKRERAEERQRQEQAKLEEEMRQRDEEILTGNPLLVSSDFTVKRRWDDDVVFRNQARSVPEKSQQRFVNDLLRSDFHRKFMNKYIK